MGFQLSFSFSYGVFLFKLNFCLLILVITLAPSLQTELLHILMNTLHIPAKTVQFHLAATSSSIDRSVGWSTTIRHIWGPQFLP